MTTNWLSESRVELRLLIELAKCHERRGLERTQRAIRQAEEFLPRYVRYTNEDCDVAQALVSAMTAPLSDDEELELSRSTLGDRMAVASLVYGAMRF